MRPTKAVVKGDLLAVMTILLLVNGINEVSVYRLKNMGISPKKFRNHFLGGKPSVIRIFDKVLIVIRLLGVGNGNHEAFPNPLGFVNNF